MARGHPCTNGYLNPVTFIEAQDYLRTGMNKPTLEGVVRFLCAYGLPHDVDSIIQRYEELASKQKSDLHFGPADRKIMDKIVWPLHDAKASYLLGNYLGTIALCGMVCEMLAILLYEISRVRLGDKLLSRQDQERIFGMAFEKLGQDRKLKILTGLRLIGKEMKARFDNVRSIRKNYLHYLSKPHDQAQEDAGEAYVETLHLTVEALGHGVATGVFVFRKEVIDYLRRKGVVGQKGEGVRENQLPLQKK